MGRKSDRIAALELARTRAQNTAFEFRQRVEKLESELDQIKKLIPALTKRFSEAVSDYGVLRDEYDKLAARIAKLEQATKPVVKLETGPSGTATRGLYARLYASDTATAVPPPPPGIVYGNVVESDGKLIQESVAVSTAYGECAALVNKDRAFYAGRSAARQGHPKILPSDCLDRDAWLKGYDSAPLE